MRKVLLKLFYKLYKCNNEFIRKIVRKYIIRLDGGEFSSSIIRQIFQEFHGIKVGYGTYGGIFNAKNVNPKTIVGRYCSFAPNIYIYNRNHPKSFISMHPFLYNKDLKFVTEDKIEFESKHICNDVWVGQNAILLPSCRRIGNGAIIAAGAVVTKDVPDYAIVAGVPAKIIGYRFEANEFHKILESEWWNWSIEEIKSNLSIMYDIREFNKKRKENEFI